MTDTHGLTRVEMRVTGISSPVIHAYRKLRRDGLGRRDANLITIGIAIASGHGAVDVRRVGRP
jgi:hypothetical protein